MGRVNIVIISQEVEMQMDKEALRLKLQFQYFIKFIQPNERTVSHDINDLYAFILNIMLDFECFIMEKKMSVTRTQ